MAKVFSDYVYELLEEEGIEVGCECETLDELETLCELVSMDAFEEYKESYTAYCDEVGQEAIWDLE